MNTEPTETAVVCRRCGRAADATAVVNHSSSDPLQVRECLHCGSVLGIGGHAWSGRPRVR